MAKGLNATFQLLTETPNEAAVAVLIPALDVPDESIQQRALRAIMKRRSPVGQRNVLGRLHTCDARWKEIIRQHRGRMTAVLRDAVLGRDRQLFTNACHAIVWFREYDLTAALITAAEDQTNPHAEAAAATIAQLAGELFGELASPRDYRERRDPQLVRQHVVTTLEASVKRYPQHNRREIVEAFLQLAGRENAALKSILHDPRNPSYLPIVDVLTHSEREGVRRLALSFLDDPHAPSAALSMLTHRNDVPFIRQLLNKVGPSPDDVVARNLKRMETIGWLDKMALLLEQLDGAEQHSLVQLAMVSGMKRLQAFRTIETLLQHGRAEGRRAACAALAEFSGADANRLVEQALDDPDPTVQAAAVCQLRQRGLPGAMTRLIGLVESPHAVVRATARSQLNEFTLERYLAAFDGLDDEVRQSTGALVRKIDAQVLSGLAEEMSAPARSRRLRAIAAAQAMRLVPKLEQPLLTLLVDEDHMVRTEAARSLAACDTAVVRGALGEALADRSMSVQLAARESLEQLGRVDPLATEEAAAGANQNR